MRPGRVDLQITAHETEPFADAEQAETDVSYRVWIEARAGIGDAQA